MGRKKRGNPSTEYVAQNQNQNVAEVKRSKNDKEESYPVKKYRSSTYYASIESFAKYTKAHRMLDASYVRVPIPGDNTNLDKPFLFSTRIGGQNLAWGRGKTRDAAIDCACRAAFSLVQAHGYEEFALDDDCFLNMPTALSFNNPPPPPPPPPLPPGALAVVPPGFPPAVTSLIPQPTLALATNAPVATSVTAGESTSTTAFSLTKEQQVVTTKGGLRLVFVPDLIDDQESCMEERKALLPRYQIMLQQAVINRRRL